MKIRMSLYESNIQKRSVCHFLLGLLPRFLSYLKYARNRKIARMKGASIGNNTILPYSLAKRANSNLVVGHNTSIQTDLIDLRSPVRIGSYVIIGTCDIITTSHNVDSSDWEHKNYGIDIGDYVWISSKVLVNPSCRKIEYGAVVGAGSVVVKNINRMSIVGGNPAVHLRYRKQVHDKLVVESLLGGDLKTYIETYKNRDVNI